MRVLDYACLSCFCTDTHNRKLSVESLDPNNPAVGRIIRDELEKTKESAGIVEDKLVTMTVQVRIETERRIELSVAF